LLLFDLISNKISKFWKKKAKRRNSEELL